MNSCFLTEKFYLVEWEIDSTVTTVEDKHIRCSQSETVTCGGSYDVKYGSKYYSATVIAIGEFSNPVHMLVHILTCLYRSALKVAIFFSFRLQR